MPCFVPLALPVLWNVAAWALAEPVAHSQSENGRLTKHWSYSIPQTPGQIKPPRASAGSDYDRPRIGACH